MTEREFPLSCCPVFSSSSSRAIDYPIAIPEDWDSG